MDGSHERLMMAFEDNMRQTQSVLNRYRMPETIADSSDEQKDQKNTWQNGFGRPGMSSTMPNMSLKGRTQTGDFGYTRFSSNYRSYKPTWREKLNEVQPFQPSVPHQRMAGKESGHFGAGFRENARFASSDYDQGFNEEILRKNFEHKYGPIHDSQVEQVFGARYSFGSGQNEETQHHAQHAAGHWGRPMHPSLQNRANSRPGGESTQGDDRSEGPRGRQRAGRDVGEQRPPADQDSHQRHPVPARPREEQDLATRKVYQGYSEGAR